MLRHGPLGSSVQIRDPLKNRELGTKGGGIYVAASSRSSEDSFSSSESEDPLADESSLCSDFGRSSSSPSEEDDAEDSSSASSTFSTSSRLSTLPVGLRGSSSTNATSRGTL